MLTKLFMAIRGEERKNLKDRNKGENEQIIDTDDDEVTILRAAEYEVQTWELFISSFAILSPLLQFLSRL